uniref:Uncharacterized protein n=1 Tax=Timema cristinae TaxID=61476 RepID=A0A7R9H3M2_TIMCR|nr:unnamed protein product [Timema cristinae]
MPLTIMLELACARVKKRTASPRIRLSRDGRPDMVRRTRFGTRGGAPRIRRRNRPWMVGSCSLEGPGMVGSFSLEDPGTVDSCSLEGPETVDSWSLEGPETVDSWSLEGPETVDSWSLESPRTVLLQS